jgi:hypothetical protein
MKNTQSTLTLSAITTLLSILTMMMILTSGSFIPSRTPAFGQEEDLGDFSITNSTEESETSPPSAEAPKSEAPRSSP